jgi:hypothetical protein
MNCQQRILTATAVVQVLHEEERERPHQGSVIGREIVKRDRFDGYHYLMKDYFLNPPILVKTSFIEGLPCSVCSF